MNNEISHEQLSLDQIILYLDEEPSTVIYCMHEESIKIRGVEEHKNLPSKQSHLHKASQPMTHSKTLSTSTQQLVP